MLNKVILDVYKRQVLHSAQAMRRFCAANPEAQRHDFWCPTYDFAYAGAVNGYRLRCMVNHGEDVYKRQDQRRIQQEGLLRPNKNVSGNRQVIGRIDKRIDK